MIKTREGFWVVAALAIAAGACSKSKAGGPDPAGGGGGAPMGMPVEVVVARMDTVRDEISATGQIEAVQSIDLRPEVDGRIVEILIREGQEVDQGTPLFKVDDAQLKAQVAQLEAQRDLAQQALARAKDLAQQNASSTADLEKAEAEARSAQAQYDLQRIRLGRTIVVKARVPNQQRLLQPGMFIEARLVTAVRPNAIVIREDAVVPAEGTSSVWVVVAGKADRRKVTLGVRTPGFVEVTDGVKAGEQVVTGGLELLAPGAPVMPRVVERPPKATAAQ